MFDNEYEWMIFIFYVLESFLFMFVLILGKKFELCFWGGGIMREREIYYKWFLKKLLELKC